MIKINRLNCAKVFVALLLVLVCRHVSKKNVPKSEECKPKTQDLSLLYEPETVHATDSSAKVWLPRHFLRFVKQDVDEIGYYVMYALKQGKELLENPNFLRRFQAQQRSILSRIENAWAEEDAVNSMKLRKMREKVWKSIYKAQNPQRCDKYLYCELQHSGFGSQMHQLAHCLIAAYETDRVVRLGGSSDNIQLSSYSARVDDVFLPLTESCREPLNMEAAVPWSGLSTNDKILRMTYLNQFRLPGPFAPPAIPLHLSANASRFAVEPDVWWSSCFVSYVMRTQPSVTEKIEEILEAFNVKDDIVGLQVRRGDKIRAGEASFHDITEYMEHVEAWYEMRQLLFPHRRVAKRVFLATDDPGLLAQASARYPEYKFIPGSTDKARNEPGLLGILSDVIVLSKCSYVVCTFSSNVCRLAYELSTIENANAWRRYHSLDDVYYYLADRNAKVVHRHVKEADNQIDLEIGDVVGLRGNHWNGFSLGVNRRTKKMGLFPSYKVVHMVNTFESQHASQTKR